MLKSRGSNEDGDDSRGPSTGESCSFSERSGRVMDQTKPPLTGDTTTSVRKESSANERERREVGWMVSEGLGNNGYLMVQCLSPKDRKSLRRDLAASMRNRVLREINKNPSAGVEI